MVARPPLFPDAEADGGFSRRRRTLQTDLDITPMIDVTFLLLIFFMVTSTMQASPDLDVPMAKYGLGVESRRATVIRVRASGLSGSEMPTIVLEDEQGNPWEAGWDDIRPYVVEGLRSNRSQVIIKADREVPHGIVQRVTRIVASVDGVEFSIGIRDKSAE